MAKNPFGGTDEYLSALSAALRGATHKQQELLQAHFASKRHTASARELAAAVGYARFAPLNSEYSKLSRRVAEHLGVLTRPAEGFWLYVLADWALPDRATGDTRFKLRPEVIRALVQLGYKKSTRVQQALPADAPKPSRA